MTNIMLYNITCSFLFCSVRTSSLADTQALLFLLTHSQNVNWITRAQINPVTYNINMLYNITFSVLFCSITWQMLYNTTYFMLYNILWHMLYNITNMTHIMLYNKTCSVLLYNTTWHLFYNITSDILSNVTWHVI